MNKHLRRLERVSERIGLPTDITLGSCKVSITGRRCALIENHSGILSCGCEMIEFNSRGEKLRFRGDGLYISALDSNDAAVFGRILSVEFE